MLAIRSEGTERVVFGHGQPIGRDPVGADGRALHDMGDVAIGAETTEGIGPGETEHIDHRVEALRLECTLERRPLTPVSPHEAGPRSDLTPQAAIDTRDRMALGQQHAHDTRTDMARSPNDTDVHRVAPPAPHCSTSGPEMQYGVFGPKQRKGRFQHGSCWMPGAEMYRERTPRLVLFSLPGSHDFSIALHMSDAARTTREPQTPASKKSVQRMGWDWRAGERETLRAHWWSATTPRPRRPSRA